mmetsp:Transcript_44982/g.140909  ORF Transcript_44982/g.140909 Transcript_44982/m.140909 type:complete len:232 (+) Transcript_44982:4825-5520(+)
MLSLMESSVLLMSDSAQVACQRPSPSFSSSTGRWKHTRVRCFSGMFTPADSVDARVVAASVSTDARAEGSSAVVPLSPETPLRRSCSCRFLGLDGACGTSSVAWLRASSTSLSGSSTNTLRTDPGMGSFSHRLNLPPSKTQYLYVCTTPRGTTSGCSVRHTGNSSGVVTIAGASWTLKRPMVAELPLTCSVCPRCRSAVTRRLSLLKLLASAMVAAAARSSALLLLLLLES